MIYCAREAHGLTPRLYCYVHQCYVCEEYQAGEYAANYPVPALWDVYADAEYLMMLYEYAALVRELALLRNETMN